jgi:hypothetical protein
VDAARDDRRKPRACHGAEPARFYPLNDAFLISEFRHWVTAWESPVAKLPVTLFDSDMQPGNPTGRCQTVKINTLPIL